MRMILKFDVGKDGFEKMILVLGIFAGITLVLGTIFLIFVYQPLG